MEPLRVRKGIDEVWKWTVVDPSTGEPRDLTAGQAIIGICRASYELGSAVLYEWGESEGNVDLTSDGTAQISIPAADSALFDWEAGVAEIRLLHPSGQIEQLYEGRIHVSPSVFQ